MDALKPLPFTVLEFSSEDAANSAHSLTQSDGIKTGWLGALPGDSQEYLVIQLDKPSLVAAVRVTNNFSGLLEVEGRQSHSTSDKWEAISAKTSLMTPLDSRGRKNGKVERDLTLKPEASTVIWDKLKFICQQPFNKEIRYGLTAINVMATDGLSTGGQSQDVKSGTISLKKKVKDDAILPGSLFAASSFNVSAGDKVVSPPNGSFPQAEDDDAKSTVSSINVKSESPGSNRVAVADRDLKVGKGKKQTRKVVSKEGDTSEDDTQPSKSSGNGAAAKRGGEKGLPVKKRGRPATKKRAASDESESEDDEAPSSKRRKGSKRGSPRKVGKPSPKKERGKKKEKVESDSDDDGAPSSSRGRKKKTGAKRKKGDDSDEDVQSTSTRKKAVTKNGTGSTSNLKKALEGCIVALSGFINPERGQLREKILEMGGKYRPDWSSECTHLVCAVAGTPKFDQARAVGGRIVKKEWISDCYANKRMIPWRTYMLRPNTVTSADADDDAAEEVEDAKFNDDEEWEPDASVSSGGDEAEEDDDESVLSEELSGSEGSLVEDDEDAELAETDEEDMEDESEMPMTPPSNKAKASKRPKKRKGGVRFDETDTEDEDVELHLTDSEEADIPDKDFVPRKRPLFRSMNFYLYGDFAEPERLKLTKTIENLAGKVKDSTDDSITHCVTAAGWCPEFEEALRENPGLMIVTPKWIVDCAEGMNLLDARKYKPPPPSVTNA